MCALYLVAVPIRALDAHFLDGTARPDLTGVRRAATEFWYFGIKEARACLFVGLFFVAVFLVPRAGLFGIPRYDVLLVIALAIQGWMVWAKLETVDELKAITLFHVIGFALEVFKTSSGIRSWSYPDFAYTKLFGVPLFAGFMYAAVGSYIIQAWRLFDLRIRHHPPYWMAAMVAWRSTPTSSRTTSSATTAGTSRRARSACTPARRRSSGRSIATARCRCCSAFVLIGFFIWLAENVSTFFGIWRYPDQLGAWTSVHWGKWSSWSLLVIMTFTIVANLKHIKERIHVPE